MKNNNSNKTNKIIILSIIIITFIVALVIFILNFTKDSSSFSILENNWINKNTNNIIDVSVYNDVPVYGIDGEGVIFDFLDSFTDSFEIKFNKVSYFANNPNGYKNVAFKILKSNEKAGDKDIIIYEDKYVIVGKNSSSINKLEDLCNKKMGVLSDDMSSVNYYLSNINNILNEHYIELPHKDTLTNVINMLQFKYLEDIQTKMIYSLIRSKMFDKYRFNGFFHIVIDGTGLYSTKVNLGEQAITKVFNKGEDNEYKLYSFYALEAKLICGNMAFSFATEFVENETYKDKNGNIIRKFEKQDCELKAAYRLLKKIKKRFPKLPVIIGGDALYMGKHFLKLCDKYKFEYIIKYKEDGACSIKKDFDNFKIIEDSYQYQNDIIYGDKENGKYYTVNVISYDETNEKNNTVTNFSYITSLEITSENKEAIVNLGRQRWKIENKGFKEQKSDV